MRVGVSPIPSDFAIGGANKKELGIIGEGAAAGCGSAQLEIILDQGIAAKTMEEASFGLACLPAEYLMQTIEMDGGQMARQLDVAFILVVNSQRHWNQEQQQGCSKSSRHLLVD